MNVRSLKSVLCIILSLVFLLNITSCATLNESECKTANWEIIGLEDGSRGKHSSHIGEHRQACADYNIAPDLKAYLKGHATGMRQFCSEQNGYQQGLQGRKNNHLCPADLARVFQRSYQKGFQVYRMETDINNLRRSIDEHEHKLKEIAELTLSKEEELVNQNTREYRRRQLLTEIKNLERESEAIHIEIDEMRVSLLRLEQDYQRLIYRERN
jgi:hypothetical protein